MELGSLRYFIDKYGLVDGVIDYAPACVRADPIVSAALAQIQIAELALRVRLDQLEETTE